MKTALIWLGALLALGVLNFAIRQKEVTLAQGETVYLRLAPVDPRSLMQGDYMVLRYAIANQLRNAELEAVGGRIVIEIDDQQRATFVRLDDGKDLNVNERYLAYKNRRGARFGIESFFFQEGKGEQYADAKYAEIRLSPNGGAMLVDLIEAPKSRRE